MKFYISVEEMRSTVVEVEAENADEAISKVEEAYSCATDFQRIK